ncbi:hypothetical protein D3C72_2312380 [compost metagenome]
MPLVLHLAVAHRQDLEIPGDLDPDLGLHRASTQQHDPNPTLMTLHSRLSLLAMMGAG